MIFFPAIDLVNGKVVRLARGQRDQMDVYSDDPAAVARHFVACGATWIHVVDLSSALGEDESARAASRAAMRAIAEVPFALVDAGGGVRSMDDLHELFSLGVERVSIGTSIVRDPSFAREAVDYYGETVVADVAARDGQVRVNGWRDGTELPVDDVIATVVEMGYQHMVYTDVARDGMQTGVNPEAYRHVAEKAGFPVVASGGVGSLHDVVTLRDLGSEVIEGVICGRAVYEGAFALEAGLAVMED